MKDPIDIEIDRQAALVSGWTYLDRALIAHDFLNPGFGFRDSAESAIRADRTDADIMRLRTLARQRGVTPAEVQRNVLRLASA